MRSSHPSRNFSIRLLAAVVPCSLLAAACGSLGEPYLGSFPTSSVPAETDGQPVADPAGDGAAAPVGAVAVEALPPRPADYVPSIVVISNAGVGVIERIVGGGPTRYSDLTPIVLAEPESDDPEPTTTTTAPDPEGSPAGSTTPPVVRNWTAGSDDLFGGLVLQEDSGEVLWFPGTGGAARSLSTTGRFLEVGYSGGTPEALTADGGRLNRTRLIDNDSTPFTVIDGDESVIDLSSSGGVVAIAKSDPDCGSVAFLSGDGGPLAIDPIDSSFCTQQSRPTVGSVALSPDGEAVAFTLIDYREDGVELETRLRAVELTSGAEILSTEIGGSGDAVSSLAFDGSTAVVLRRSSARSEVVVADADQTLVLELGDALLPRAVTFARLPLSENLNRER